MPKPIKQEKLPRSINQLAHTLVELSTQEAHSVIERPTKIQISQVMAELGRRGGKVGGKRRLETMTAKERSATARKAAQARWSKKMAKA